MHSSPIEPSIESQPTVPPAVVLGLVAAVMAAVLGGMSHVGARATVGDPVARVERVAMPIGADRVDGGAAAVAQ